MSKSSIGHSYPREIEFIDKLPKTRSGKIMQDLESQRNGPADRSLST